MFVFCLIVWLGSFRGTELNLSSCVNIQFLPCPSNLRGACSSSGLSWGFRGDRGSCAAFCLSLELWGSSARLAGLRGTLAWQPAWGRAGSRVGDCPRIPTEGVLMSLLGQQRPRAVCSPTALARDALAVLSLGPAVSQSSSRLTLSPGSPLLWTGAETTSHTTNLGYFRH